MGSETYTKTLEKENEALKERLRAFDDCESCVHDDNGKCSLIHTKEGCCWAWKGVAAVKE